RVGADFALRWLNRFAGQARSKAAFGHIGKSALDHAVFEAVESDDAHARPAFEPPAAIDLFRAVDDLVQQAAKCAQLIVDGDAKGHEGPRGWVHAGRAGPSAIRLGDQPSKPCRSRNRLFGPLLYKFSRDLSGQ